MAELGLCAKPSSLRFPPRSAISRHNLSTSEEDHVLLFVTHHIVCDFWSLVVMLDHLQSIYRTGISEPDVAVEYDDYVKWEFDYLEGPDGDRLWEFWKGELAGQLPLLNLPTNRPFPRATVGSGFHLQFPGRRCGERGPAATRTQP